MMGINSRSSGRKIFKTLKTLTVPSQYILSLMTFLAYNLEYLTSIIHSIVIVQGEDCTFICHEEIRHIAKGVHHACIEIFNSLPKYIADSVKDKKQFVVSLGHF
jgi:hypothetical protein